MAQNLIIANRLREIFLTGTWIANTNYTQSLAEVSWEQAVYRVLKLNTIAALTYHINYYLSGLLDAFENNNLVISDKFSFDVPEIRSEEEWTILKNTLPTNAGKFSTLVEQMNDSIFDNPFIDDRYGSILRNIEGVIEHSYYHLGQISLLKKMLPEDQPKAESRQ